jgi:hypothetical protein
MTRDGAVGRSSGHRDVHHATTGDGMTDGNETRSRKERTMHNEIYAEIILRNLDRERCRHMAESDVLRALAERAEKAEAPVIKRAAEEGILSRLARGIWLLWRESEPSGAELPA